MADYQTLAGLAAPHMMPNAPLGAGATAGWMYGADQARQDDLIRQATQQAGQTAQTTALDAELRAAQQPGRLADAAFGNQNSRDKLDVYSAGGQGKALMGEEMESKLEKIRAEFDADTLKELANSENEAEATKILSRAKQTGGLRSKSGRDLADLPPEAARKLAKTLLINTPKHMQELETIGEKAKNAVNLKGMDIKSKEKIAALRAQLAKDAAAAKAAQASNKPLTASQAEAMAVMERYKDDPKGMTDYFYGKSAALGVALGQAKSETAGNLGIPGVAGPEVSAPIPNPSPSTPTQAPTATPAPTGNSVTLKAGETLPELGATYKGKKVIKRLKNPQTGEVKLVLQ